eukprot:s1638_g6.t1
MLIVRISGPGFAIVPPPQPRHTFNLRPGLSPAVEDDSLSSLRDLASKLAFGTSEPAETNKIQQALHILAQENMAPVSKPSSSSAQTFQGEAKSNSARVCLAWVLACLLLLAAGWSFSSECVDSEDGPGSATAEAAMVALVFGLAAAVGRFSKPAPPLTI